ncbi:Mitochondrial distribution and morphology protein 31, mitochondrial precursor [Cladochytrium tenue]|nr:Mitochondrial distribution and morphology protein 31, mitochondrial precursor [Cladochytrium tenue]
MKGVRGVVDRRHIIWDPDWVPTRRKPHENDFMMSKFVVEDLLLTILNPSFRPYTISVFNGELPLFRQQWLLYDLMCADSIVGTFDDCLFSIHRAQDPEFLPEAHKGEQKNPHWAKMVGHLKISGVPIEHMNTGVTGPFGWITSGSVDLDFHIFIPQTTDGRLLGLIRDEIEEIKEGAIDKLDGMLRDLGAVEVAEDGAGILELRTGRDRGRYAQSVEDIIRAEGIISSPTFRRARLGAPGYGEAAAQTANARSAIDLARYPRSPQSRPVPVPPAPDGGPPRVYFHCNVALNDLRASVPLTSPHISYLSNALIRPIVAYMNAHRTKIPLAVDGKLPLSNFDGAWTFHSAGLIDLIGEEIGRAVTMRVLDERERMRHLRRIGVWSIQNATKGVMNVVDYARGVKRWEHWAMHFGSPWYSDGVPSAATTTATA